MTPLRRRPSWFAVPLLALIVAACGSNTPTSAPSTGTPPSAGPSATASPAPTASAGAPTPSPSAAAVCDPDAPVSSPSAAPDTEDPNAELYAEIEGQVSELRGLTAKSPVERAVFDTPGLCDFIKSSFAKDNPEELVANTETLLKSLLLLPQDASLHDLYIELLTSQVAGLYDDETKKMYVVTNTGEIGPTEEITYAHEYTHALQDQSFDLRKLVGEATDQGDRTLARTALVEGDATLLMSLWAQQNLTPAELAEVGGSTDPNAEAILERMPAILKEPLLFPYTQGLQVALGAFGGGGFSAVDGLFSAPPDSTEQVLHPDKLAAREAPVKVSFPDDLAKRLGDGWSVPLKDTLGELQLEILLREGGASATGDAAAGWGGDRVALVEGPDGATGVVLDTTWDTADDAGEFAAALDALVAKLQAAGRSASVLTPAPDRVVLVTAESDDTLGRIANVLGLAG